MIDTLRVFILKKQLAPRVLGSRFVEDGFVVCCGERWKQSAGECWRHSVILFVEACLLTFVESVGSAE